MKINKICKALTVIMITIMCIIGFSGCGKDKDADKDNAYKEPLELYFSGIQERNLEKVLQAFPDFMNMGSMLTQQDIDVFYENYESELGPNITISYSFGEPVRYEGDDLEDFKAEIVAVNDNVNKDDITDAYFVPVTMVVKGDGIEGSDVENSTSVEDKVSYYSFKYQGKWYVR